MNKQQRRMTRDFFNLSTKAQEAIVRVVVGANFSGLPLSVREEIRDWASPPATLSGTYLKHVLEKHGYVELNGKERRSSRATHQHRSAHKMHERYALTLDIDDQDWVHFDHRGDTANEGRGIEALDRWLKRYHECDDE